MIKYHFKNPIYSLLLAFVFLTSCHGQVKPIKKKEQEQTLTAQARIPQPKGPNKDVWIGIGIEDADGNLWFGSNGEGLYKFDGKLFVHFGQEQGLNSNIIYSILQDKSGNVWVGANNGLYRYDGTKFESIPINLNTNNLSYSSNTNSNLPATENAVWSMMQDRKGTLWFGTDEAVYCYDGIAFKRFLDNPGFINKNSLQLKGIFWILETKNGSIWFAECAGEGITSFDGKTLSTIIPYNEIGRTDRIIEDRQNNLWFATAFKGIGKYDGKTYTQNVFKDLDLNGSYHILEDTNGHLWFDTHAGLGFYDGKKLKIFTERDGTFVKDLSPVLLDKSGNLWFSSQGMKLFKYNGSEFINFSE